MVCVSNNELLIGVLGVTLWSLIGLPVQGPGAFKSSTRLLREGEDQSLMAPAQPQQHLLPGTETDTEVETETGRRRELGMGEGKEKRL